MNRREEYEKLMQELESPVPALENTLDRAKRRMVHRNRIVRPLVSVAAAFLLFVVLVNFCTPVAYACSKVPFLRDLAEAVTFSRSLSDAVDNEYVQLLYLAQADGEVSASVDYLIVDQKQVNVFFRLYSDTYTNLAVDPVVLTAEGEFLSCSYGLNEWNVPNGELQSITIDFMDEDVPDSLQVKLNIRDMSAHPDGTATEEIVENSDDFLFDDVAEEELEYIAHLDFLLEFDPTFTATGKVLTINQTVVLDGQEITFTEMEIYPTHLRINVEDSPENTAWLKGLDFYIETDWGMQFDTISNGIVATGTEDSPMMVSFRADSSYFYEAKHLKLVITGAEWLSKDMEKIYVNLQTGETGQLPEGVTLHKIEQRSNGWLLEFLGEVRKPGHQHQLFLGDYYDAAGNKYHMNSWSTRFGENNEAGEMISFIESFPLKDYAYEEVWVSPCFSHVWRAQEPVMIQVQ